MDARQIRGAAIIAKGDTPQIIEKNTYLVPSQSDPKKRYQVAHTQKWTCTCPDYICRAVECKHIHAIQFWLKFKTSTQFEDVNLDAVTAPECPNCHATALLKRGTRATKKGPKQRYACRACQKRFVLDPLKYLKATPKMLCLALDCYYKGLSLRDIKDTFFQFYGMEVNHETIRRWVRRFSGVLNEYTKTLSPRTSTIWNADEQMVRTKKGPNDFMYNWNVLDHGTKFLLASRATYTRGVEDATAIFREAHEQAKRQPDQVITDRLASYQQGVRNAFKNWGPRREVTHTSIVGRLKYVNNNAIENYHTHFREFDKVRRGINHVQDYSDGFRVFHNFIRKAWDGKTPAERAAIGILKDAENRWEKLLLNSLRF